MGVEKLEDYQKKYEEFWKTIVEKEDGTLNKDHVMRELFDYSFLMEQASKVYCEVADLSKTNYDASVILDKMEYKYFERDFALDDFETMSEDGYVSLKDIKEYLKN